MPRKKTNGPEISTTAVAPPDSASASPPSPDRPLGPLSLPPLPPTHDIVKVNNSSATELKNACDDALKRYLSRPGLFKQSYQHTDVRLTLGWLSVFVACGTGLYGYKVEFEQSKPFVWVGLILYMLLTFTQTLYAYFIEGDIIFVGKRKTFSKRIITERITLTSCTRPVSFPPKSATVLKPTDKSIPPQYALALTYVRSTSANKSLLAKGKTQAVAPYSQFFDADGKMDTSVFERWVGELVEEGMDGKDKSQ